MGQSYLSRAWPALKAEGLASAVQLHAGLAVGHGVVGELVHREPVDPRALVRLGVVLPEAWVPSMAMTTQSRIGMGPHHRAAR